MKKLFFLVLLPLLLIGCSQPIEHTNFATITSLTDPMFEVLQMSGDVDMTTINSMSDAAQKDIISVKYYIESNVLPVYGLQSGDTSTSTISFQGTIPYTRVSEEGFLISFLDEDSTVLLSYYGKVNGTDNDNTKKAGVFDYNTTITFTNKDVALQDVVYIKIRSSNNPKRPTNQYDMIYTEK